MQIYIETCRPSFTALVCMSYTEERQKISRIALLTSPRFPFDESLSFYISFFFRSGIHLYASATERTSSTLSSVQTGAALKELPDFKLRRSRNFFYCVEVLVVSESPLTATKFCANKLPRIFFFFCLAFIRHINLLARWQSFCFPIDSISN